MRSANIVISSARSGTNYYLETFSKLQSNAFIVREIFRLGGDSLDKLAQILGVNEDEVRHCLATNPVAVWNSIIDLCRAGSRPFLAKIFYYHKPQDSPLWKKFRDDAKIVHLIRRNQFDTFLSLKIAQKTGKWMALRGRGFTPDIDPFEINRDELSEFCDKKREYINWIRYFYSDVDYHEVFYEDISRSTYECAKVISKVHCLPIPEIDLSIHLEKQKKRQNHEIVLNYEEVCDLDAPTF